jgi:hypothetical protein
LVGDSADTFAIVENANTSMLVTDQPFNNEDLRLSSDGAQVTVSVIAEDKDGVSSEPFDIVIEIKDVNEKPERIELIPQSAVKMSSNVITLEESKAVGSLLGSITATDPDADSQDIPAC